MKANSQLMGKTKASFPEPSGFQPLPQRTRPSDCVRQPQPPLGFLGGHSTSTGSVGLILYCSELGCQLLDALAQLLSLSMTGSKCLICKISARLGRGHAAVSLIKLLA